MILPKTKLTIKNKMANKKSIIYIRTSTEEQHPENQLRDCETLVNDEYEIVSEQQSAWKDKDRPLFEDIKNRIKKSEIDNLYCWDLDRLFRNRKKLVEFFQFCKIYKCQIHSFRQKWLEQMNTMPSPWNEILQDFMLQIMGWIAQDESDLKSQRVKIAFKNSTKKWGRRPLENIEEKVIELHKLGKSVREISKEVYYWDESRNKKFVSKSAVHEIVSNFKRINS